MLLHAWAWYCAPLWNTSVVTVAVITVARLLTTIAMTVTATAGLKRMVIMIMH
jgi:hypothetical protein